MQVNILQALPREDKSGIKYENPEIESNKMNVEGSVTFICFQTSNDSTMRQVYSKAVAPYESSFAGSYLEVIERVCTTNKYAFLSDRALIASTKEQLTCSTLRVPKAYIDVLLSLVIQKRSPYVGIFRHT